MHRNRQPTAPQVHRRFVNGIVNIRTLQKKQAEVLYIRLKIKVPTGSTERRQERLSHLHVRGWAPATFAAHRAKKGTAFAALRDGNARGGEALWGYFKNTVVTVLLGVVVATVQSKRAEPVAAKTDAQIGLGCAEAAGANAAGGRHGPEPAVGASY